MSETIYTGWLQTRDGDKFAPRTLAENLYMEDGKAFYPVFINNVNLLSNLEQKVNKLTIQVENNLANAMQIMENGLRKKPGLAVAGDNFQLGNDTDGKPILATAQAGAEIFNDLNTNIAIGVNSHAEGTYTKALSEASHAEGMGTIIDAQGGHVEGRYNNPLDTNYLHIAGNGTPTKPSNAHTLDWGGNAWYSGDLSFDGKMVITPNMYGTKLPETGVEGQLFFLILN